MNDLTILVTGCGSPGAYGLIKSLRGAKERSIRIIGIDIDPLIANRYLLDQFYIAPRRGSPEFVPYVLQLSRSENVDLIYPVPTAELEMFALAVPSFEAQGQRVVISNPEALAIANNKARLFERIAKLGLACTPEYQVAHDWKDLVNSAGRLGYPGKRICIKPPIGTGSIGLRILDAEIDPLDILLNQLPTSTYTKLDDLAQILECSDPFPEMIVMEYLPGEEYDVDILAYEGQTLAVIPRKNEKMWYGLSLVSTAIEHSEIIQLSRQIILSLGLSYVVSISFRLDNRGQAKLIEINPRIPGSIIAATMAGVNMPYLAIKLALGEGVEIDGIKWGTQMIRYWEELFIGPDGAIAR